MSQEGTVRGPGRAIIGITLIPPTAVFVVVLWAAIQHGSLAAVIEEFSFGVGAVIGVAVYAVAAFVVLTGRVPFVRRSHEQA